jgi:hypothetical protein
MPDIAPAPESSLASRIADAQAAAAAPAATPVAPPAVEAQASPVPSVSPTPVEPITQTPPVEPLSTGSALDALLKGELPKTKEYDRGLAPEPSDSRGYQRWSELRDAYDNKAKAEAELKAQIETYKLQLAEAAAKIPQDYEDIKKTLTERETRLAQIDLTARPEYQQVVAPMGGILSNVKNMAESHKLNWIYVDAAMHAPDTATAIKELSSILEGAEATVPQFEALEMMQLVKEYQQRNEAAQSYLNNAPNLMSQIKAREQAEQEQRANASKLEFSRASEAVLGVMTSEFPELNNPDTISKMRASTTADWNSLKPATQASLLMAGNVLGPLQTALKAKDEAIKARDAELAGLRAKMSELAPSLPGTNEARPAEAPSTENDFSGTLADRINRAINRG